MHTTHRQRSASRRHLTAAILVLIALSTMASLPAPSAQGAVKGATFSGTWGAGPGSGSGQLAGDLGVAVNDASGDVYVADTENSRVVEFGSSGAFIRAWGFGVTDGTNAPQICNAPAECQAGVKGGGPGQFFTPSAIAVDNSNGPNAGDVYVLDQVDGLISRFSAAGAYRGQIDGSGSPHGTFQSLAGAGLAVDNGGTLWVLDQYTDHTFIEKTGFRGRVMRFSNQPDNNYVPGSEVSLSRPFTPGTLLVNGSGTQFYVIGGEEFSGSKDGTFRYDANGENKLAITGPTRSLRLVGIDRITDELYYSVYVNDDFSSFHKVTADGTPIPDSEFGGGVLAFPSGLTIDALTKTAYVLEAGKIFVFDPLYVPDVSTGESSNVGHTVATLSAEVAPDARGGGDVSECKFEYGLTTSYGSSVPCSQSPPMSASTAVSATIGGLSTGQTYHYRVSASNANGANQGEDRTFVPPAVLDPSTDPASEITRTSATLNGSYLGEGKATSYYFEWGPTSAYGETTPLSSAGEGSGPIEVSAPIEGLEFYKPYHYRLVATNSFGTARGADRSFFTRPPALPEIGAISVSAITPSSATIESSINPGFGPTTFQVDYGTTKAYGSTTLPSGSIGEDDSLYPVVQQLEGLKPGTVYHYRLIATNFGGTSYSPDGIFVTPGGLPSGPPSSANLSGTLPQIREEQGPIRCKKGYAKRGGKCRKAKHRKRRRHSSKHQRKEGGRHG